MASAPRYQISVNPVTEEAQQGNLSGRDQAPTDQGLDSYTVMAVIRLGLPLSFSRAKMASVTNDVSAGALLRATAPLVITDDCVSFRRQTTKRNHVKTLTASLKQTTTNYLNEIFGGDWLFGWLVYGKEKRDELVAKINAGKACNNLLDGLKFVGRVFDLRKNVQNSPNGVRSITYTLQGIGFAELDSQLFYDATLASDDQRNKSLGSWLARLGLNIEDLFGATTREGIQPNNTNTIVPTLLDLIVGKGPPSKSGSSPVVDAVGGVQVSALPQTLSEPPYAYLVPMLAGQLLGINPSDASKASHVISYADIMELLQGVQTYSGGGMPGALVPDLADRSTPSRRFTPTPLLGTYLPFFPEFTNRPLFQVLQQYANPAINELYTTLRVNPEGQVMPTLVFRQIPFTTEAFPEDGGDRAAGVTFTRFLSLPRWVVPPIMVESLDVGRSDATRTNFVHVYGASSLVQNNVPVQYQLINNPPIIDELDVQRSGLRPYMTTVECWLDDQVGKAPGAWMALVADRMMGSQYTLNGTVYCYGIQAPIAEGDNLELGGVVYHIEGVMDNWTISETGEKSWRTAVQLSNGMRASLPETPSDVASAFPIYVGFDIDDLTTFDPRVSLDGTPTTGGVSNPQGLVDTRDKPTNTTLQPQLAPEPASAVNPDDAGD